MLDISLLSVIPVPSDWSLDFSHVVPDREVVEVEDADSGTNLSRLVHTLAEVDRLFQDACQLARNTHSREEDLSVRVARAEREQRRCQQEAEHWREQYASLERRIPWWVRRLFGAPPELRT